MTWLESGNDRRWQTDEDGLHHSAASLKRHYTDLRSEFNLKNAPLAWHHEISTDFRTVFMNVLKWYQDSDNMLMSSFISSVLKEEPLTQAWWSTQASTTRSRAATEWPSLNMRPMTCMSTILSHPIVEAVSRYLTLSSCAVCSPSTSKHRAHCQLWRFLRGASEVKCLFVIEGCAIFSAVKCTNSIFLFSSF